MGLFKRKLTPEELEEKSRKEKEWADKCYNAGKNFAEKHNLKGKVDSINCWINKYPKTFITSMFVIVLGSLVFNLFFNRCNPIRNNISNDFNAVTISKDTIGERIKNEIDNLYKEMDVLNKKLERFLEKDSLTQKDSVEISQIIIRMKDIGSFIEGREIEFPNFKKEGE